jgi:hypothetical protein
MLGYNLAQWRFGESHRYADNVVTVPQPPAPSLDHSAAAMFSNQERQKLESEKRLALISSALTQAQAEKLGMTQELATLARQAAANAESERQLEEERQKVQRTTSLVSSLQAELGAARKKQSDLDVILTAQKDAAMDANAKLAHLQAQFEHEGDMKLTKSQYEEIISARNLHIVDVYDVETNGRRQKSFGRIFYVEGRSLVFYAYDLPNSKHPNKNLAFHVWGEKAGTKATSFQLGIMHPDDPIQNRWVLTFDDPKVLNRITAVYITINPPAQPSPQGRQLMYAFLGNPNHP